MKFGDITNFTPKQSITIALDVMGGDNAPNSVLDAAEDISSRAKYVHFKLYGQEDKILPIIENLPNLKNNSDIIHCDDVISGDDKASKALRMRKSSMYMAIKAVKDGEADSVISAGNTGALMAISTLILRTLEGISRPAISSVLPTTKNPITMLDLGANLNSTAQNLYEFAVMGSAFAKTLLGYESPSIGLLNIGFEDMKGNEEIKEAATLIKANPHLNYKSFVEGDYIGQGYVDVVVADGFSGNIALKTVEGTAKLITHFLKESFKSSVFSKIAGLVAMPVMKKMKSKLDHRLYNGGMLLGLNGIVVKSHGGTDAIGYANAIGVAIKLVDGNVNKEILEELY